MQNVNQIYYYMMNGNQRVIIKRDSLESNDLDYSQVQNKDPSPLNRPQHVKHKICKNSTLCGERGILFFGNLIFFLNRSIRFTPLSNQLDKPWENHDKQKEA